MNKNGLTLTMIILAESANYGEGVGNISTLKKKCRVEIISKHIHTFQGRRYGII